MFDSNCPYCNKIGITWSYPICDVPSGTVYFFKEQSKPGRCAVAYHNHVSELVDISDDERNLFFQDVAIVARAMHRLYKPNKINYGAFGDTMCHLHFHLVPKYEGEDEWGGTFTMDPKKKYVTVEECKDEIDRLRTCILEQYK